MRRLDADVERVERGPRRFAVGMLCRAYLALGISWLTLVSAVESAAQIVPGTASGSASVNAGAVDYSPPPYLQSTDFLVYDSQNSLGFFGSYQARIGAGYQLRAGAEAASQLDIQESRIIGNGWGAAGGAISPGGPVLAIAEASSGSLAGVTGFRVLERSEFFFSARSAGSPGGGSASLCCVSVEGSSAISVGVSGSSSGSWRGEISNFGDVQVQGGSGSFARVSNYLVAGATTDAGWGSFGFSLQIKPVGGPPFGSTQNVAILGGMAAPYRVSPVGTLPLIPGAQLFPSAPTNNWFDTGRSDVFLEYGTTGGALFARISSLPVGFDVDDAMTVSVGNNVLGTFSGGQSVDFVALLGTGVSSFRISGINEPSGSVGFPVRLEFSAAQADFTVTPAPEPSVGLSLCAGFALVAEFSRRGLYRRAA